MGVLGGGGEGVVLVISRRVAEGEVLVRGEDGIMGVIESCVCSIVECGIVFRLGFEAASGRPCGMYIGDG